MNKIIESMAKAIIRAEHIASEMVEEKDIDIYVDIHFQTNQEEYLYQAKASLKALIESEWPIDDVPMQGVDIAIAKKELRKILESE